MNDIDKKITAIWYIYFGSVVGVFTIMFVGIFIIGSIPRWDIFACVIMVAFTGAVCGYGIFRLKDKS